MRPEPGPWLRRALREAVRECGGGGRPFTTNELMEALRRVPVRHAGGGWRVRKRVPGTVKAIHWMRRWGMACKWGVQYDGTRWVAL